MVLLSLLPLRSWRGRLIAGGGVAAVLGVACWLNWPQCLAGAYQISPELQRLWLDNIREAKPIYRQTSNVVTPRSEEHTSELQSLMRISYAVFCLKKKNKK